MTQPSLEKKIVSSSLKSNEAFVRIDKASKIENAYTPYTSYLLKLIDRFYDNDKDAKNVDVDVLIGWIEQDIPIKSQSLYINYLRECYGVDVSAINIADLVLSARKKNIGNKLAQALLEDDSNKINSLKEQYDSLDVAEEEEEEEDFCGEGVSELLAVEQAGIGARIKLLPKRLNEICKGRARRGHHIVLFARPETGKTAATLTLAYGFALQGLETIIFGNEEPVHDTRMRAMCCFTGLTEEEIKANPQKAQELLDKRGWNLVRFIPLHPGTPKQIERYVERYKPDVIIVDQIRNLAVGAETRVNQLEMAATAIRNIAKRHNCMGVSITQAGDSADNKLVLEMGDVDFSNCLAKGTQVLMYDGSKKAVEDIRIGEQVMGMDGTVRNVLATGRGVQPLYKITHKNGDNYTVNQSHIMTVRNSDNRMEAGIAGGCVGDLPLQTLLDRPGLLKRLKGIWSEGSDFITKSLPIDPYLFGLWLADGFSHTFSISTSDEQLANYLCNKYKKLVPSTRIVNVKNIIVSFMRQDNGHRNPLNNVLRGLGVIRNKHIPDVYLRSSREQRLQLLAGLIDGDGSLRRTKTTASDCFTIYIGDNEQLANDTIELCKSLGFYCMKGKSHPTCFVVRLSGAVTKIPTVLDRKKATRDRQIRFLSSNLTIEKVTDSGEFYGITVDKDKRYVLGNYIVTHNTGIPATADLMVGIGVNKEYEANGMRVLSTPKNKIGGVHSNFPVKINTTISRLEDI